MGYYIICGTEFFTDEFEAIVPQKPKEAEPQAETEAPGEESREEGRKNINTNFLVIAIVVNTIKNFPFLIVPVIELSEEQKAHILNSGEFSKFFDKAARLMERALCETVDITFDYSGAEAEDTEG